MKTILRSMIRAYQTMLSPFLGSRCRFFPSCSQYAEEAVMRKGAVKGVSLAVIRFLKCNPLHPGGFDPVE